MWIVFYCPKALVHLPIESDTVSDSFGKEFIRNNDAVWIISRGVVAREISDGETG